MEAVRSNDSWSTRAILDGRTVDTKKARELWRAMAQAAWECGDPGLQFDTTVNDWHTSSNTARINASNPCSEYMYLDDSACNLASLNLRKFQRADSSFDVEAFKRAVEITILAQEIIVGNARYPTPAIEANSHRFRPLGLGYANLGSMLMSLGIPYDSEAARAWCGSITALMTGWAYRTSAAISRDVTGPFDGYPRKRGAVPGGDAETPQPRRADRPRPTSPSTCSREPAAAWDEAITIGKEHGFRNGQATVLAPTGTIGFMMDCDTTGIEPDIALIKYKRLVGGGMIKIVNNTTEEALARLGYDEGMRKEIIDYVDREETIEGAPGPQGRAPAGVRLRLPRGQRHAVDPLPGSHPHDGGGAAVHLGRHLQDGEPARRTRRSRTCENAYMEAWKHGLKAIAIYRDGCKRTQPLSTSKVDPGLGDRMRRNRAMRPWPRYEPRSQIRHWLGCAPGRSAGGRAAQAARRAPVAHAQVLGGGPRGLHPRRPLRERPAGRDLRAHGQGGLDHLGPDGQLRDRHLAGPAARRAARACWSTSSRAPASSRPASPATRRSRGPPRSWTTCSAGWASKFCRQDENQDADELHPGPHPPAAVEPGPRAHGRRRHRPRSWWWTRPPTPPSNGHSNGNGNGHENGNGNGNGNGRPNFSFIARTDAPTCSECGSIMVPNGSCHKCINCGTTSGCS